MKWDYLLSVFLDKYCPARGLRPNTIGQYREILAGFRLWVSIRKGAEVEADELKANDLLDFIKYLRVDRAFSDSTLNCHVVVLRTFYRGLVALELIEHSKNPTLYLPKIRAPKRKVQDTLSQEEVRLLLNSPNSCTVIGLRDRAILALLYGTGIRASECAGLKEGDVDLQARTIKVIGKGGYHRVLPLNDSVKETLERYRAARGRSMPDQLFFRTRKRKGTSRGVVYSRVKRFVRLARIGKRVTPHTLRHTFATHLMRMGEKLVVLRDLLGHKQLSSTQVYLHMSAEDLRNAADRHPVTKLLDSLGEVLPGLKLPFQHPPGTRFALNNR